MSAQFKYPFDFEAIIHYLDSIAPGNPAIKAAIDIALHDLDGKDQTTTLLAIAGQRSGENAGYQFYHWH